MTTTPAATRITEVTVPDIGDFHDIPVIEVHVSPGDLVADDDPLVTLESDKATMDVPAPQSGTVDRVGVAVGDRVNIGSVILTLNIPADDDDAAQQDVDTAAQAADLVQQDRAPEAVAETVAAAQQSVEQAAPAPGPSADGQPHAGPSVRRLARELGVELATISGSGPKGRITKEDLRAALRGPGPGSREPSVQPGAGIPQIPAQDFARFGPVETRPLSRIKTISGAHLHRSWLNVPHVTQNDEADITDLDAYRRELDTAAKAEGYRVTLLAFLLKAAVSVLREHPELNCSLSPEADSLIYKSYYHIGVAVDTPNGLVVPVLRDVDRKGVSALSKELGEVSTRARAGTLSPADMQGGTFTISSLGGIGGTSFTPIVNAPEVAILGVVRAKTAPVWDGTDFRPRLVLPVSLSYDHRVVDGALAARATRRLCHLLEDVRRLVL